MKIHVNRSTVDYDGPVWEVILTDLSDAQLEEAWKILSGRFNKIWVPLPICGGELNKEEGWGWMVFDGYTVMISDGCIQGLIEYEPEGEDRLDGGHPHWTEPNDHTWMRAMPFVNHVVRPLMEIS
jgi:hypothetical protein